MTYEAAPGYYPTQPRSKGSGLAIAALVLGILALVTCWTVIGGILLGLVAIVLGFIALSRVKRGLAQGKVMAIIGIATGALGVVLAGLLVALSVSLLNSDSGQSLQDCLDEAGSDSGARTQCQREFEDDLAN